jgi:hypothetical protein
VIDQLSERAVGEGPFGGRLGRGRRFDLGGEGRGVETIARQTSPSGR